MSLIRVVDSIKNRTVGEGLSAVQFWHPVRRVYLLGLCVYEYEAAR